MRTVSAIARYLAGAIFLVFGLNGFLNFIPLPQPGGHRGTVHGRPVHLALPVGDLRVSGHPSGASAGQPLRTVGGGCVGAGNSQHSFFPRFDGPERPSAGALRGYTVGGDIRRRATGFCRVVPVALGRQEPDPHRNTRIGRREIVGAL
jgi:hypothetical protein